MPKLRTLRMQVDALDSKLLALICRRQRLAACIGQEKQRMGLPIINRQVERRRMQRVSLLAKSRGLKGGLVRDIFVRLIQESRALQRAQKNGSPHRQTKRGQRS